MSAWRPEMSFAPSSSPPLALADSPRSSRRWSGNIYCWDDTEGYRIYKVAPNQTVSTNPGLHRSPAHRRLTRSTSYHSRSGRPLRKPVPLRIPATHHEHQVSVSSSDSLPSVSDVSRFNLNFNNRVAKKLCVCGNPEPVLGPNGSATDTAIKRSLSATSCICKFTPTVQDAQAVRVRKQRVTPQMITHLGPVNVACPPRIPDLQALRSVSEPPPQIPLQTLSGSNRTSRVRVREVSETEGGDEEKEYGEGRPRPLIAMAKNNEYTRTPSESSGTISGSTAGGGSGGDGSSPVDLEGGSLSSSSSKADHLRRGLFRWTLVRLFSDTLLLALVLLVTLMLLWPAIEQTPFPSTSYAGAPHVVGITSSTKEAALGSGSQNVTTLIAVAPILTGSRSKEALDATTTGKHAGNGLLFEPLPKGKGYFVPGTFTLTLHAEFRAYAFPILIVGCGILQVLALAGTAWTGWSLRRPLRRGDGWAASSDGDRQGGRLAASLQCHSNCWSRAIGLIETGFWQGVVGATGKKWRQYIRGIEWTGHRVQCVQAARYSAISSLMRMMFVLGTLLAMMVAALCKVKSGRGVA